MINALSNKKNFYHKPSFIFIMNTNAFFSYLGICTRKRSLYIAGSMYIISSLQRRERTIRHKKPTNSRSFFAKKCKHYVSYLSCIRIYHKSSSRSNALHSTKNHIRYCYYFTFTLRMWIYVNWDIQSQNSREYRAKTKIWRSLYMLSLRERRKHLHI